MDLLHLFSDWFDFPALEDVRRVFTALFITIDLVLIGIFGTYVVFHYNDEPYETNLPVQASFALGTYFFGRLILQVYGWLGPTISAGGTYSVTFGWDIGIIVPLLGSTVTIMGAAWTAVVFTPIKYRFRGWGLAVVSVALFLALTWKL